MHQSDQASSYRSLYAYAWDVQDIGVSRFVDEALAMGIQDVTLATSYHAGKFLRPHAVNGPRVIFPEDGVVYFDPDFSRYGEILPQAHSDAQTRAILPALLADGRIRVHGWTVLLHNSRLGSAFPQYCTQNVFGDRYVYSLCPMQAAVFDYADALSADLARQHAVSSIVLETPGWLPYTHGYHHEFAQVKGNAWLDDMLGLCFCDACIAAAKREGIAAGSMQQRIQQDISACLAAPPDVAPDQAAAWLRADMLADAELLAYLKMRQRRVTQLATEIRRALPAATRLAVIPTVQRPTAHCWMEGSDLAALAQVADYLEIPFYEPTATRTVADAWDSLRRIGDARKIRAILRPGVPDLANGAELPQAIDGLQQLGVTDLAFYNYGLLPQPQLDKLAAALHTLKANHES